MQGDNNHSSTASLYFAKHICSISASQHTFLYIYFVSLFVSGMIVPKCVSFHWLTLAVNEKMPFLDFVWNYSEVLGRK